MFEHVLSGWSQAGWILFPLAAMSLAGWYLVVHRFIALTLMDLPGVGDFRARLAKGDWEGWIRTLSARRRRTVAGELLASLLAVRHGGREAMESKLDEIMKFRIPELESSLSTVAIIASAAPLVGLLGTVAGIVETFEVIAAFGTGNQALMSDSIAEALMATQNGLLVAFPLLIMHVVITSKAEAIEKKSLAAAHALINRCCEDAPGAPGLRAPTRERTFA